MDENAAGVLGGPDVNILHRCMFPMQPALELYTLPPLECDLPSDSPEVVPPDDPEVGDHFLAGGVLKRHPEPEQARYRGNGVMHVICMHDASPIK